MSKRECSRGPVPVVSMHPVSVRVLLCLLCRLHSGSALHVLTPLHLHAAEGSIRLRQRSALVLAPCGGSEAQSTGAPAEGPCSPGRLPLTGLLLGAAAVVSSAASISVGEGAAIRIMPGPQAFHCAGGSGAAVPSPQQGAREATAMGVSLLAGERLLLHGVLGLAAAPSDCLPAPLRKTPLLLFGGREVSLRGEQQLDRLVLLSQGSATLAGTCTVGPPHRCNSKPTPLSPSDSFGRRGTMQHSTVCRALEEYAGAHVAPQLEAAAETERLFLPNQTEGRRPEEGEPLFPGEAYSGSGSTESGGPTAPVSGEPDSSSFQLCDGTRCLADWTEPKQDSAAGEEGLIKSALQALRRFSAGRSPKDISGEIHPPEAVWQLQERYLSPTKEERLRGMASGLGTASVQQSNPLELSRRVVAAEALGAPFPGDDLRWKKWTGWRGLAPFLGQFVPGTLLTPSGPSASERHRRSSAIASPVQEEVAGWNQPLGRESSLHSAPQGIAPGGHFNELSPFSGAVAPSSLVLGPSAASFSSETGGTSEAPAVPERGSATAAPQLGEGHEAPVMKRATVAAHFGGIGALFQGGAIPWDHLDAAIFAREGLVVDSGASLIGGALLLCGGRGNTELQGTVDASRRGCQPAHGETLRLRNNVYAM